MNQCDSKGNTHHLSVGETIVSYSLPFVRDITSVMMQNKASNVSFLKKEATLTLEYLIRM